VCWMHLFSGRLTDVPPRRPRSQPGRSSDGGSRRTVRVGPERDQSSAVSRSSGPLPWFEYQGEVAVDAPPRLTSRTVDDFLSWASRVPNAELHRVKDYLGRVEVTSALNDALHRELLREPIEDVGRHLILLATIGELRHPDAALPLEEFIRRESRESSPEEGVGCQGPIGVLEARAVEMLAHLRTAEADTMVLRAIREHPFRAVRAAAVDAYLFNHDDSKQALSAVRRRLRPDERHLVGMARWSKSMDVTEFEAKVDQYYRQHPSELPPPPTPAATSRTPVPSEGGTPPPDHPTPKKRRA
jgi:hypothetical protein